MMNSVWPTGRPNLVPSNDPTSGTIEVVEENRSAVWLYLKDAAAVRKFASGMFQCADEIDARTAQAGVDAKAMNDTVEPFVFEQPGATS